MAVKYSNGHKIYQHFSFQSPPKFIQIAIFGMKVNHPATLDINFSMNCKKRKKKMDGEKHFEL
jgi:hypothetical protein